MTDEPADGPQPPMSDPLVQQLRRALRAEEERRGRLEGDAAAWPTHAGDGEPVSHRVGVQEPLWPGLGDPLPSEPGIGDGGGAGERGAGDDGGAGEGGEEHVEPVDATPTLWPTGPAAPEPHARRRGGARRGRSGRGVAFVAALVVLIAAVPALGWYGLHLVFESHGGTAVRTVNDPAAPGYVALVTPTPTALVIQVDAQQHAVSLTLLSLSGQSKGGGTVLFIPLDTAVPVPAYGIDRLRTAYVRGGATVLASETSQLLKIGFSEVITVDAAKLASLVGPVAPLTVDNPDRVSSPAGDFARGPVKISAERAAAYLTAHDAGESDLERLNRQSQFWSAWLGALGSSSPGVGGSPDTGIGHYVSVLAAGPVTFETLPVTADTTSLPGGGQLFHADAAAVAKLIAIGVPYPVGVDDQRVTLRLLNGVDASGVPTGVVQALVLSGGQINELGNASHFGVRTTQLHYSDPALKPRVDALKAALGGKGREVLDDTGGDTVKVTIVLGSDVLDHPPAPLLSGLGSGG